MSNRDELLIKYHEIESKYEKFLDKIRSFIVDLLDYEKIRFNQVQGRIKNFDSCFTKMKDQNLTSLDKVSDLIGIRIVCYLMDEKKIIASVMRENFYADVQDKNKDLGLDKFGYRSLHLDNCKIIHQWTGLPIFENLQDIPFEIQICTVLEHGWSEIEHDTIYKPNKMLSWDTKREINAMAASLENMDRRLSSLAMEREDIQTGQSRPIKRYTLRRYLYLKMLKLENFWPFSYSMYSDMLIGFLNRMGIDTINKLDQIFPIDYVDRYKKILSEDDEITIFHVVIDILIIHNSIQFFSLVKNEYTDDKYLALDPFQFTLYREYGINTAEFPSFIESWCT